MSAETEVERARQAAGAVVGSLDFIPLVVSGH